MQPQKDVFLNQTYNCRQERLYCTATCLNGFVRGEFSETERSVSKRVSDSVDDVFVHDHEGVGCPRTGHQLLNPATVRHYHARIGSKYILVYRICFNGKSQKYTYFIFESIHKYTQICMHCFTSLHSLLANCNPRSTFCHI